MRIDAGSAIQIYEAFNDTLKLYESRVSAYEEKIDTLQGQLLDAEKRATAAETESKTSPAKKRQPATKNGHGGNVYLTGD